VVSIQILTLLTRVLKSLLNIVLGVQKYAAFDNTKFYQKPTLTVLQSVL